MQPIMENVEQGPSKGGNQLIDVDEALGYKFPETTSSYDERDLAIYALGVGAARDPNDDHDLQLVYEMHGSGMKALPTYGVVPAVNTMMKLAKEGKQAPGPEVRPRPAAARRAVHRAEAAAAAKARLSHRARIKDIFDKGKHALIVTEVVSYDEDGNELMRNELTSLIRGAGGWGGDRGPAADVNVPPDRAPDATVEEKIPDNQALLYRLSGDWNPLHADPGLREGVRLRAADPARPVHLRLRRPSRGLDVRPDGGDPRYFKSIRTRFAASVFPGETLVTEMWKESDGKILFRCKVKERDEVVISNAAVELYAEIPKPKAKPKQAAAGVGMVKFAEARRERRLQRHGLATRRSAALEDAGVDYGDVEQAYAGYVFGDSTCGQRAVYEVGLTGIPVFNVNNNCSTGSSALMLAKPRRSRRLADCVIAVGFEKMEKGALGSKWTDRTNPLSIKHVNVMSEGAGLQPRRRRRRRCSAAPGREYRWKYGTKRETFAKISEKARSTPRRTPTRCSATCSASRRSWRRPRSSIRSPATSAARRPAARRRRSCARMPSPRSTASRSRSTSPPRP
jgi:hypothetical protein